MKLKGDNGSEVSFPPKRARSAAGTPGGVDKSQPKSPAPGQAFHPPPLPESLSDPFEDTPLGEPPDLEW